MREYAQASIQLDQVKIVSDTKCCLIVQAIISKSGVYDYPEGPTLKPVMELLKATRTARYAKLVVGSAHPITEVVCQQDQVFGGVEKPFWDRTKMRANLNFDKSVTPKAFLNRVRAAAKGGKPLNNSIGFYYRADWTPGEAPDVNTGKKRKYVRIMRDIMIDHVLVGEFQGRCNSPQCGIGIGIDCAKCPKKDTCQKRFLGTDKVVKRGDQWCIIHTHGEKAGTIVKGSCHANKSETEAMHRAIEARKHGAAVDLYMNLHKLVNFDNLDDKTYKLLFGVDAERTPKEFMDACMPKAEGIPAIKEPGAFCNWVYNNGPEALKKSFGSSSVQKVNGGKKGMSQEEKSEEDYQACLTKEKDGGATEEEAKATCKNLKPTVTADQDKTPMQLCIEKYMAQDLTEDQARLKCKEEGVAVDQEPSSPWQACIIKYTSEPNNLPMAEAITKCKAEKVVQTDQEETEEEAYQRCVVGKQEIEGMTLEEAQEACKPEVTETLLGALAKAAGDQEGEPVEEIEELPTPLQACTSARKDATGESEETAEAWCKDELAGLHQPADEIVTDIMDLKAKEEKLSRRR